jgi:hypothetical protein
MSHQDGSKKEVTMRFLLSLCTVMMVSLSAYAQDEENLITVTDEDVTVSAVYNYNFGFVQVGDSERARFRLRNNGSYPFYINSIRIHGEGFSRNENCPSLLWPGQSCRATVRFTPMKTKWYTGELDFNLTGRSDIQVYLRGRGYKF